MIYEENHGDLEIYENTIENFVIEKSKQKKELLNDIKFKILLSSILISNPTKCKPKND